MITFGKKKDLKRNFGNFRKGLNINVLFDFKKRKPRCLLIINSCLNIGLNDPTLTANILITVSPSVPQIHSISKHDSPIISMLLSISWWPIANNKI